MNTETRFTPGPWVSDVPLGGDKYGYVLAVGAPCGKFICRFERPTGDANGELIAAAPDMYAALKDAREYVMELLSMRNLQSVGYTRHGQIPIIEECLENIDAALTKAEGQS